MVLIRHAATIDEGHELVADLCIVGAGAAGITLALQFAGTGLRVLLLEGGEAEKLPAAQSLYAGTVDTPDLHSPPDRYRERRFGGTTTVWSGRCLPYDPIDFDRRPWIADSGWPISYEDVARHYPAAMELCEAGEFVFSGAAVKPGGMRPLIRSFTSRHFDTDPVERFSCPTNFGARYRHRLEASRNVDVILGANVTELLTEGDGARVKSLVVRGLDGRRFTVAAQQVVLATGGLEIPRLLLASRDRHAAGLGNQSGLVGRFYMCHIAGTIGDLRLDVDAGDVNAGYEQADDGTYCRRRLALTPEAQAEHGLANALMRLHFPAIPDPSHGSGPLSALYLAKPFVGHEHGKRLQNRGGEGMWLRHALNVARDPLATSAFLWRWLRYRTLAARKFPSVIVPTRDNRFSLDFHGEQVPNRDSRVTLGGETDAFGMPRLAIAWRHSPTDIRTAEVALDLFAGDLRRWGRGRLTYDRDAVAHHMLRDGAYGGHHIGTTRMSANPTGGVVDPQGRVHGVANLHIAGASVFPTSSQANPTLTVVAMALGLAETLKRTFAARPHLDTAGLGQRDAA
ncbi:GMC family oxidoreductase [Methylobacterium sp. J-076]|uniref:GMC family oxidoreductase n=1 Tax=Methylobacterium sp. J-076 TaxID=2836655 RepID=UPI002443A5D7|nr:GMC family oxidoreductase [Methylobacterium sp. J-076]